MRGDDGNGVGVPTGKGTGPAALTPFVTLLMSAACGMTVGNIYLCQPLLDQIARYWHLSASVAGLVAVAAQAGYTLGILLVVPLADVISPKRLMRVLLSVAMLGLLAAAAAPGIAVLIAATLVLATATAVPQILIPIGAVLAGPNRRSQVIGTLQTGLVLGILLSRVVSGAIAEYFDTWRAAYISAAGAMVLLLLVLPRYLPSAAGAGTRPNYLKLMASLLPMLSLPPLRLSFALGFCLFGAFSAFWATIAFRLAGPGFEMGPAFAGLLGLFGVPGAILAPTVGRYSDRVGSFWINLCASIAAILAFIFIGLIAGTSIVILVIGINLLDFGLQSAQVANQARVFAIATGGNQARLNTVYMVGVYTGGALGSWAGTFAWGIAGWPGVNAVGGSLAVISLLLLLLARRQGKDGAAEQRA